MEEELKKEIQPEKKKGNIGIVITFIVIAFTFCVSGYSIRGMVDDFTKDNNKKEEQKEEPKEPTTSDETKENDNIPYSDKVVFSTYGDMFVIYMVNDGNLYYQTSASKFAGLNVCPSKEAYCKFNPTYNNDMTKVDGIENVKRVKMTIDLEASDERFKYFAITNDGNVYIVNNHTADKTNLTNVEDLVNISSGESDNYYEFQTKDGKTIKLDAKK